MADSNPTWKAAVRHKLQAFLKLLEFRIIGSAEGFQQPCRIGGALSRRRARMYPPRRTTSDGDGRIRSGAGPGPALKATVCLEYSGSIPNRCILH
jgi:hypothetical protein